MEYNELGLSNVNGHLISSALALEIRVPRSESESSQAVSSANMLVDIEVHR
jgi:hypothetical protein